MSVLLYGVILCIGLVVLVKFLISFAIKNIALDDAKEDLSTAKTDTNIINLEEKTSELRKRTSKRRAKLRR